ncbi:YdeI family protein [Kribbella sp. NPDC004536]|uniref:YdeI/OmpD-associated family protein n=1 Tax=Kribbella sp. NPDC004536 TaxID=3364106 RepID=UPI003696CB8D
MTTELIVVDAAAWHDWLRLNHGGSDGVWLVLAKKNVTDPTSLTYDEALEEALCHGWIDGQRRGRDEQTFIQRYTPRRARSMWSLRNVGIVARLEQDGRMRDAGRAEVERAKADGRWDKAYGPASARDIPEDLAAALAAEPKALAMFEILTSANRFAVIFRVNDAKRPETRTKRIALYVEQLARGETIYPQKRTL